MSGKDLRSGMSIALLAHPGNHSNLMHAPNFIQVSGAQPPQVLASLIGFLRVHSPFSGMQPSHLHFLAKRLRIAYYPRGSEIETSDDGATDNLYIVKQGRIAESSAASSCRRELGPGDCFVTGAAVSRSTRHARYRTLEDTFCLELERETMNKLVKTSAAFRDFYDHLAS
ncbi:MAG TPA: cyclic nucleotide-binding domain-containing protein [Rhodocyclaceae bacterium]|nr:cyclic nucleotide-binding domain-containing protein [Rhodocyclaceae bacterium]